MWYLTVLCNCCYTTILVLNAVFFWLSKVFHLGSLCNKGAWGRPPLSSVGKFTLTRHFYDNHSKIFNTIVKHRGHMILWKHHTFVRFGIHDFYTVKFNLMSIHLTWRNWCKVAMLLKAVAQQLLSEHCGHACIPASFEYFSSSPLVCLICSILYHVYLYLSTMSPQSPAPAGSAFLPLRRCLRATPSQRDRSGACTTQSTGVQIPHTDTMM